MKLTDHALVASVTRMVTQEIVGLSQLHVASLLPLDALLLVGDFISYNRLLEVRFNNYCNQNLIAYIFSLLQTSFIDPDSRQILQDINRMVIEKRLAFKQTRDDTNPYTLLPLPASDLKNLRTSRQNGMFFVDPIEHSALSKTDTSLQTIERPVSYTNREGCISTWSKAFLFRVKYWGKVKHLQQTLSQHQLQMNWLEAVTSREAFKKIIIKLHPDKGGNTEDFKSYTELKALAATEITSTSLEMSKLFYNGAYTVTLTSQAISTGNIIYNFLSNPTTSQLPPLLLQTVNLLNIFSGTEILPAYSSTSLYTGWLCYSQGVEQGLKFALVNTAMMLTLNVVPHSLGVIITASFALADSIKIAGDLVSLGLSTKYKPPEYEGISFEMKITDQEVAGNVLYLSDTNGS